MLDGIFPWSAPVAGLPVVLSVAVARQYLSGFLIGCGVGGVVGASTLGVAMFSLSAPTGELKNFTAVVPVVNCCANVGTVLQYSKHANRSICMKMWPFIVLGICVGTWLLPRIDEASLRKFTSVVYALVLAQSVSEYFLQKQRAKSAQKEDDALKDQKKASEEFYGRIEVAAAISILCGLLTVLTNNSGPIFNIYLLNCGLSMNQFVATRAVLMAGKNVAKVGARLVAGSISVPVIIHGLQIGVMCLVGIQCAKPIKDRTSPQLYKFFTWGVLLYTAVKMWLA